MMIDRWHRPFNEGAGALSTIGQSSYFAKRGSLLAALYPSSRLLKNG
jgi:hypothetical protein